MPLFPATGVKRNDLYTNVTNQLTLITDVVTTVQAAGWTATLIPAFSVAMFTAQPANNDTITLAGQTYTFVTAIGGANTVLIGATTADTANNLIAAVTGGAGSGTTYGAATVTNTSVSAQLATATAPEPYTGVANVKFVALDTTIAATGTVSSKSCPHITWYFTYVAGGSNNTWLNSWGYELTSGTTPQGLKMKAYIYAVYTVGNEAPNVRIVTTNSIYGVSYGVFAQNDATPNEAFGTIMHYALSNNWRVIANQHQYFLMVDGISGAACQYGFTASGTPYVPSFQQSLSVTGATNATPIVITTSVAHGWSTSDNVCLRDVGGNTAANSSFTITVLTPTTFSLDTSVGSGAYTSGGHVGRIASSSNTGSLAECIWMVPASQGNALFRTDLTAEGARAFSVIINGAICSATGGGSGTGTPKLVVPAPASTDYASNDLRFYNNMEFVSTPWFGMGTAVGGQFYIVGALFDALLMMKSEAKDTPGTFGAYNMVNLTDANGGSTSSAEGSFYVVVP